MLIRFGHRGRRKIPTSQKVQREVLLPVWSYGEFVQSVIRTDKGQHAVDVPSLKNGKDLCVRTSWCLSVDYQRKPQPLNQ